MDFEEFDVAERLHQEARRGMDEDDPAIVQSEFVWAGALNNARRPRDALEILTRVRPRMELWDAFLRTEYNKVMAVTLFDLGRFDEALPSAAKAVELSGSVSGPQSPETLDSLFVQAQVLAETGRFEAAKATL